MRSPTRIGSRKSTRSTETVTQLVRALADRADKAVCPSSRARRRRTHDARVSSGGIMSRGGFRERTRSPFAGVALISASAGMIRGEDEARDTQRGAHHDVRVVGIQRRRVEGALERLAIFVAHLELSQCTHRPAHDKTQCASRACSHRAACRLARRFLPSSAEGSIPSLRRPATGESGPIGSSPGCRSTTASLNGARSRFDRGRRPAAKLHRARGVGDTQLAVA